MTPDPRTAAIEADKHRAAVAASALGHVLQPWRFSTYSLFTECLDCDAGIRIDIGRGVLEESASPALIARCLGPKPSALAAQARQAVIRRPWWHFWRDG